MTEKLLAAASIGAVTTDAGMFGPQQTSAMFPDGSPNRLLYSFLSQQVRGWEFAVTHATQEAGVFAHFLVVYCAVLCSTVLCRDILYCTVCACGTTAMDCCALPSRNDVAVMFVSLVPT